MQPKPEVAAQGARAAQLTLIGAMAIWGLNVSAVKALTTTFDPLPLACLRMVIAAATLVAIVFGTGNGAPRFSWRQGGALCGCAFLMVYLNQVLFSEGLLRTTAVNGSLIMALSPLFSSVMAALVFSERFPATRMAGVVLGFAGVAMVVLSHAGASLSRASIGDGLLIASVVSFAAGGVLIQRLTRRSNPLVLSCAIYIVGSAMLLVHTTSLAIDRPMRPLPVDVRSWALVLFSALLATAVGNLVWNRAISTIGIARTAVFFYWVPVFGVLFAAIVLGEQLTWWHLAGFASVMTGTWLGTRPSTPPKSPMESK